MWNAGARLCRMEGEIGTLAPGARANLVAVDIDPFNDIAALGRPADHLKMVWKNGVAVQDRRAA